MATAAKRINDEPRVHTLREIESSLAGAGSLEEADPVHARMRYPFVRLFRPLGFPLELSSNSPAVLDAAEESWAEFAPMFRTTPIRVQVGVLDGESATCPPPPRCLAQRHHFSFVADRDNFGVCDLERGFTSVWVTRAALEHRTYFRYFFLECAAMSQISTRNATGIHAGCVEHNGRGVLLCGDSGAGKSTLSYACAKAGWTYVTDDGSYLVHDSDDLLIAGNCHQVRFRPTAATLFPEIEGQQVTQRAEVGKPSIELRTAALPAIQYAQSTTADFLVFLNRREGINGGFRPYSKQVAAEFLRQGRFAPHDLLLRHYAAISRLLNIDVLELRYRDLDWAIEQLRTLTEAGRV